MNTLIYEIAGAGQSLSLYYFINTMAAVISLLFSLWHGKKFGISVWKMLIILLVVYGGVGAIQGLISPILDIIKKSHFWGISTAINSIVRTFVFLPLIAIFLARIFRLKWSLVCDAIALFPLGISAIAQTACIFPGCCHGYESILGIYNIKTGLYHFPVQILETILTLGIFAYLVYKLKRKGYVSDGMLYPEMMALYGAMRFLCEGLRDNEKIFLGCSGVSFHALAMCVIGLIILLRHEKRQKQIAMEAEPTPEEITVTN